MENSMKKTAIILLSLILFYKNLFAQDSVFKSVRNDAFTTSEVLEYRVHYGPFSAGEARLEVMPEITTFGNRRVYHVVGTGKSTGAFDMFFKVRDRYESFIDSQSIIPWYFIRRVNEGGYLINQNVTFNHFQNKAISEKATISVPEQVQDLISAYYYARTINFDTLKLNDIVPMHTYLDDEVINLNLRYLGKEKIKTGMGTFNCIKFIPVLLVGRVFKDDDDMTIWVTDDKNRIVVRAQADVLVGSIKMDLKTFSGLANPLLAKVK